MKHPALIITLVLLLVTCACTGTQSTNGGESVTDTLSSSQTSVESESTHTPEGATQSSVEQTATSIPEQPTSTPTTTLAPTPTLPASTEHGFSLGELLFQGTPDCELPCWYGITPGPSTENEVDTVVQSVFGIDFSQEQHYGFQILPSMSKDLASKYYMKSYPWFIPSLSGETNPDGEFRLGVALGESNRVLEILQMEWLTANSTYFEVDLSPLEVIRELGAPSHVLARPEIYGSSDFGGVRFLILYDRGIVFQFFYNDMTFDTTLTSNPAIQDTHVEICLGTNDTVPQTNIGYIMGDIFLLRPFSSDLSDLSPVQESAIMDLIEFYQYAPIDEVFGVSPQAIAAQAAGGDDVCLSTIFND